MTNKLYSPSNHSYDFGGGSERGNRSPVYKDSEESYDFGKKGKLADMPMYADGGEVDGAPDMAAASRNSSNLPRMNKGGQMNHRHKRRS